VLFRRQHNFFVSSQLNVYKCVPVPSIHKVHSFVILTAISATRIICLHFHFYYRNLLVFFSHVGPSPETKHTHAPQNRNVNAVTYVRFNQHNKVDRGSDSSSTQPTWMPHAVRRYSSRIVKSRHVSVVPRPCITTGAHRTGGRERSKEPVRTSHQRNAVDNKLTLQEIKSRSSGHTVHVYNITLLAHSFCYSH
jgi:hypothetical protein